MKRVLFLVLTLAAASCSGRTVALTSFALLASTTPHGCPAVTWADGSPATAADLVEGAMLGFLGRDVEAVEIPCAGLAEPTCAAVTDYALEVSKNSGGRITSRTACSVTWQLDDGED